MINIVIVCLVIYVLHSFMGWNGILDFLDWNDGVGLNTPTDNLNKSDIRKIVKEATAWCTDEFGVNRKKKQEFTVSIRKQKRTGDDPVAYGEYDLDNNTIIIYYNNCPRVKNLVKTLIHEYTHYLQPISTKYHKLLEEYGYDNHPMEVEARENEDNNYRPCWKYIKSVI